MAQVARYAPGFSVDFEQMDEDLTVAVAKRVEKLRQRDQEFWVELASLVVRGIGTIVARAVR